ncbi:hypothetical protein ACH5RR_036534 [Cinchona calisaya]|uniref:Uncharacterized protein n=1 Tax=Cinchona calisaya TaxID=153742 RepID=A0ABD2Y3H0_9GENT
MLLGKLLPLDLPLEYEGRIHKAIDHEGLPMALYLPVSAGAYFDKLQAQRLDQWLKLLLLQRFSCDCLRSRVNSCSSSSVASVAQCSNFVACLIQSSSWIVDSGAFDHIFGNEYLFTNLTMLPLLLVLLMPMALNQWPKALVKLNPFLLLIWILSFIY